MGSAAGVRLGHRRLLESFQGNLPELGKGNHPCTAVNAVRPSILQQTANPARTAPNGPRKRGGSKSSNLPANNASKKGPLKSTTTLCSARAMTTAATCKPGSGSILPVPASTRRNMKLIELLKEITPLPWRFAEMDNNKVIPTVRIFGRRKHDPSKEVCFGRLDSVWDARYACHAANVLPGLAQAISHAIEAFRNVPPVGGTYDHQHSNAHKAAVLELEALLAKTQTIEPKGKS